LYPTNGKNKKYTKLGRIQPWHYDTKPVLPILKRFYVIAGLRPVANSMLFRGVYYT